MPNQIFFLYTCALVILANKMTWKVRISITRKDFRALRCHHTHAYHNQIENFQDTFEFQTHEKHTCFERVGCLIFEALLVSDKLDAVPVPLSLQASFSIPVRTLWTCASEALVLTRLQWFRTAVLVLPSRINWRTF